MDGSNGLVSAMVPTLDQYYLLDSNPSSQAITNIARELDVSKEVVARYFDDRKWNDNKDDVDNLLSEVNSFNFQIDDSSNLAEINYLAPIYNSQGQASLSSVVCK